MRWHAPRIVEQRKNEKGQGDVEMTDVLDDFQRKARDHARVPMQVSPTILTKSRIDSNDLLYISSGMQLLMLGLQLEPPGCV